MKSSKKVVLDYKPQGKQKVFHLCQADEVFYGGAAGGGKSMALFYDAVNACINIPGYVAVIFRKTFPELESTHIRRARALPKELGKYKATAHEFHFPNGSILEFRYCERESDVYKYQSGEWDAVYIDELTHFSEFTYFYLITRVRTTKTNTVTKVKCASNPGNIGHEWVKRRFVSAASPMEDFDLPQSDIAKEIFATAGIKMTNKTGCFIPATVFDNPALMNNDPGYLNNLMQIPDEDIREQLLRGDWDRHSGQYFDEWDRYKHVVKPFEVPDWWFRFGAYDPGFAHNAAFGWFAVSGDGDIFLYRELVKNRWGVDDIAAKINSYEDTRELKYMVAGRDLWLPGRGGGESVFERFTHHKLLFSPATIDRVTGWQNVRAHLKHKFFEINEDGKEIWAERKPKLQIFSNCVRTIECIPILNHDKRNGEDVHKIDANDKGEGGDDAADMLRYGLMSRKVTPVEPEDINAMSNFARRRKLQREEVNNFDIWNQDI